MVGIAGVVGTYWAGKRQAKVALKVARIQGQTQVTIANSDRHQRRIDASYMELRRVMSLTYDWVLQLYPLVSSADADPDPAPPDSSLQREAETLMVFWSPRIQQLMDDWRDVLLKITNLRIRIQLAKAANAEGDFSGEKWPDLLLQLRDEKQQLFNADDRVRAQMSRELRGEDTGEATVESG